MKKDKICALILIQSFYSKEEKLEVEEDLGRVLKVFQKFKLVSFFESSMIPEKDKIELIQILIQNRVMRQFLLSLIGLGMLKILPNILNEYTKLLDQEISRLNVFVLSFRDLTPHEETLITEKVKTICFKREVRIQWKIDESMLFGFQIYFNNTVIDTSLKTYLMDLGKVLCI